MNFQCLVPSFDPPKLKWQNMNQKLELLQSLLPINHELNEEKDYSKYSVKLIRREKERKQTTKYQSEDVPIQLFDGQLQYRPIPPSAVPVITMKSNSNFIEVSNPNKSKVPAIKVNAFQRMMSTVLSVAENDDCELNETVVHESATLSGSGKLLNRTGELSISEILSSKRFDAKVSSQKKLVNQASSGEKSMKVHHDKSSKSARKISEEEAKLVELPPSKKKKISESISSAVSNHKASKSKGIIYNAIDFELDFVASDFQNVQHFCRNAGSTPEVLTAFLSLVLNSSFVGISLIYSDLSTNHVSMSKKYCTPSTRCSRWNCTCDKHIRAQHISLQKVLGIVVYIPPSAEDKSTSDACYFLPLRRCVEPSSNDNATPQNETKPLPLKCDTTLNDRNQAMKAILACSNVCKVLFNAQVSAVAFSTVTETSTAPAVINISDPRVASYLLNPDIDNASSLDLLPMLHEHHISLAPEKATTCDPHLIAHRGRIADVIYHTKIELIAIMSLAQTLSHQLQQHKLAMVFHTLEMPLAFQLGALEERGVAIDTITLLRTEEALQEQLRIVSEKIYELSGTRNKAFNIASPEQLSRVLFQHLSLIPPAGSASSTHSGKFISTSEETLSKIRDQHPIIDWILTFRSLFKLIHTYIDGLKPYICTQTQANNTDDPKSADSVHALWNQLIVRTGRLSCSKPNLQNIPTNFSLPQLSEPFHDIRIRSFFQARPGYCLVAVDYSQIEMRVLAHVTNDPEMCALFRDRNGDIYKLLASKIFRKPSLADVSDQERTRAKVICLGCIYGMGAKAAANKLGIDVLTVSHITQAFFQHFQGVSRWIHRIRHYAKQHREVRTLSGRLRRLPEIISEHPGHRATAERQAVNTVIQGTASDLIKSAMLLVSRAVTQWEETQSLAIKKTVSLDVSSRLSRTHLIMQIHDELIFEVPMQFLAAGTHRDTIKEGSVYTPHVQAMVKVIRQTMEDDLARRWQLRVPLLTTIRIGENWGDMSPWNPPIDETVDSSSSTSSSDMNRSGVNAEETHEDTPSAGKKTQQQQQQDTVDLVEELVLSNSQYCEDIDRIALPEDVDLDMMDVDMMDVDISVEEEAMCHRTGSDEEEEEEEEEVQIMSEFHHSDSEHDNDYETDNSDTADALSDHMIKAAEEEATDLTPAEAAEIAKTTEAIQEDVSSHAPSSHHTRRHTGSRVAATLVAVSQKQSLKMPTFFAAMESDSSEEDKHDDEDDNDEQQQRVEVKVGVSVTQPTEKVSPVVRHDTPTRKLSKATTNVKLPSFYANNVFSDEEDDYL